MCSFLSAIDFFPFAVAGPPELTKPVLARAARLERRSMEGLDDEEEVTENMINVKHLITQLIVWKLLVIGS